MRRKKWTVLMYLNGNNELGREMESTLDEITTSDNIEDINIVAQISKAPIELVNMIRQDNIEYKDNWTGVRRYTVINNEFNLEQSFDYINMADYTSLYEFIKWGMEKYPAERYMLTISGHGFMVEALTDLGGSQPYTMGIYEMCLAINNVKRYLNKQIDILTLDICNMNSVEVLYELGKNKENTVKNVLTYIHDGPIEGMNYSNIIKYLDHRNSKEALKDIVQNSLLNLIALGIDHSKLEKIKRICNSVAYSRLFENENKAQNVMIYSKYTYDLNKIAQKLIIAYNSKNKTEVLLDIMCFDKSNIRDVKKFSKIYFKLSFTKNNYCSNLMLLNKSKVIENTTESKAVQEILTRNNIMMVVKSFNCYLCSEQIIEITDKIYEYRKWSPI